MRSINVVVALLFGYFVAAVSNNDGNDYVVPTKIDAGVRVCVFSWKAEDLLNCARQGAVSALFLVLEPPGFEWMNGCHTLRYCD